MKKCLRCLSLKSFEFFHKKSSTKDGYQSRCKECRKEILNKSKNKSYNKEWRLKNPDKISEWRKANPDKVRSYSKTENARKYQREYFRKRRAEDPIFNLIGRLRSRTRVVFLNFNFTKQSKTSELLGCEWESLKIWIENKFINGMSWENKNLWHIDHIVPLSSARDEISLINLCHYTNLQPLWIKDNLSKGKRIDII
jgi:hypothetical protein